MHWQLEHRIALNLTDKMQLLLKAKNLFEGTGLNNFF
jgi:hypothetical protein